MSAVDDLKIPNPGSSLHTLALPNGEWLMVNNNLEKGRNELHLNHSKDEGKTWRTIMEIEKSDNPEDSFSYPTLISSKNDEIHLSYSLRKQTKKTIVHAVIQL